MNYLDGYREGYVFLKTDNGLSEIERLSIVAAAFGMHVQNISELELATETFVASIHTEGKYGLVGVYGGIEYTAQVRGGDELRFLVHEPASAKWN